MPASAPWRDRDRLVAWLAGWAERVRGRGLHRVDGGPGWVGLQLAGDDRAGLLLGALPGAVLLFPFAAPLPAPLRAALVPVRRHQLADLLRSATLVDAAVRPDDLVVQLAWATPAGPRLLRHQLFGGRGGTVLLEPGGRLLWTAHPSPHPCLLDPDVISAPVETVAGSPSAVADDLPWSLAGQAHLARQLATALADSLQRAVERRLASAARLVANLERDLAHAATSESLRQDAETLATHLHALARGTAEVTLASPADGRPRTIVLDPALSPAANLERLFKQARRTERGRQVIAERLAAARAEQAELTAAAAELAAAAATDAATDGPDRPDADRDLALDRLAAVQASGERWRHLLGPAPARPGARAPEEPARPFRRFLVAGRWEVWVGRNGRENDELTHRASHPRDLWLHAQGVEGSHVVLRTGGRPQTVPRPALELAAALAAHFSKARHSSLVPVLWTERRYVRRPRGASPGTAVCLRAESLMVEPGIAAAVEPA